MIAKCRQCGKHTVILYPQLWAYKQDHDTYYCSWKCLRAKEKEEEALVEVVTKEQKDRAVQIAIDGGDPRPFLAECGSKSPDIMWGKIREKLSKENPERFAQLPERIPRSDCGKRKSKPVETPEGEYTEPKITQPVAYDGMIVREVEGLFGRYRYSDIGSATYIDFEATDSVDTLSLTVEQWRVFRKEQERAARILGVEL